MALYNNVIRSIDREDPPDEGKIGYEFWESVGELPVIKQIKDWNEASAQKSEYWNERARSGKEGLLVQGLQVVEDTLGTVVGLPFQALEAGIQEASDRTNIDPRTFGAIKDIISYSKSIKASKSGSFYKNVQVAKKNIPRADILNPGQITVKPINPKQAEQSINKVWGLSRFRTPQIHSYENRPVHIPRSELAPFQKGEPLMTTTGGSGDGPRPPKSPYKSPGGKKREDILSGKRAYPSIEEMTLANRPPQPIAYKRPTDLNKKQWETLGLKLQADHGGSDYQRESFIKTQRDYLARLKKDQKIMNEQFQFDYLQFATTAIEEGLIEGVSSVEDLYGNKIAINDVDDLVYALYVRMAQDPTKADVWDKGHVRSGRVLEGEGQESADYVSNLRLEIRRTIKDWNQGAPIQDVISTGKPPGWKKGDAMIFKHEWKGGKDLEKGNLKRRDLEDSPKVVDLMLGTSPNIEVEYQKHLGVYGSALDEIIPTELESEFRGYLKKRWRKWQGWGESKVLGKQQLDLFEKKINQFTDDFLNDLEQGKAGTKQFQDAREDAELDILRDGLSGKLGDEEYKAAIRRIAREVLKNNREKRNIIDKLFPDEHRP